MLYLNNHEDFDLRISEMFIEKTNQLGLYNIQSIANIGSIMQNGLLSYEKSVKIKHVSIAMNEVQIRRDEKYVPNGLKLHQYANLYFDPRNPMLSARRKNNEELCILKIDCSILNMEGVVVSDRNASSSYASFYQPEIGLNVLDFDLIYARYWTDEDKYKNMEKKSIKCAEVLVPYKIPVDYITSAAVVSNKAKMQLEDMRFEREIVVEPNMFF